MRLHAPIPQAVIVRVTGALDERGAAPVASRIAPLLPRAAHLVLDLGEVPAMEPAGVAMLAAVNRDAGAWGAHLHLAGIDHAGVAGPLAAAGLDQALPIAASAEAVIALLPRSPTGPTGW